MLDSPGEGCKIGELRTLLLEFIQKPSHTFRRNANAFRLIGVSTGFGNVIIHRNEVSRARNKARFRGCEFLRLLLDESLVHHQFLVVILLNLRTEEFVIRLLHTSRKFFANIFVIVESAGLSPRSPIKSEDVVRNIVVVESKILEHFFFVQERRHSHCHSDILARNIASGILEKMI